MKKSALHGRIRSQLACEACYLLNEAIRQLVTPHRVIELSDQWRNLNPVPVRALAAVRHMALMSIIINIFRLKETRDQFLSDWLFSEEDLRALGFPPVEDFIGGKKKWKYFEILRNQYAGHVTVEKAKKGKPGSVVPARVLGKAIREAGIWNFEDFLRRVMEELAPGVERVRDKLGEQYPEAKQFIETYALELDEAVTGRQRVDTVLPRKKEG